MRSPARNARSHKWQTTATICHAGALHHTANGEPDVRTRMRQQLEVHTATERDRARGKVAQSGQRRTVTTEDNSAMVAATYFGSVRSACARERRRQYGMNPPHRLLSGTGGNCRRHGRNHSESERAAAAERWLGNTKGANLSGT